MSEVGRNIIMTMTWFQFVTAQLLAVIMLSNAISSEIHHKTLDVLMTTPITCLQIVVGKLASAMLQLILLLSISFTVLGIVRVYGGVQWDYVISTFCVTVTGCIFCGSLSLFFSIKAKQAYTVIVKTLAIYMIHFALTGICFALGGLGGTSKIFQFFVMINPFAAFYTIQLKAMPLFSKVATANFNWPLHCMTMLLISSVIIAISAVKVRKNALRQLGSATSKKNGKTKIHKRSSSALEMRYMVGSPIIQGGLDISKRPMVIKYLSFAAIVILIIIMNVSYIFNSRFYFHNFISIGLWMIAALRTGSMAAASIAREKESRSLAVLLTTPLTSGKIVIAKAKAAAIRNLPLWALMMLSTTLFMIIILCSQFSRGGLGFVVQYSIYWLISFISIPVYIFFATGTGLYCGAKFKNQSTAVIGFVIIALGLFVIGYVMQSVSTLILAKFLSPGMFSSFYGIFYNVTRMMFPLAIYSVTGIVLLRKTIKNLRKYAF